MNVSAVPAGPRPAPLQPAPTRPGVTAPQDADGDHDGTRATGSAAAVVANGKVDTYA